MLVTHRYQAGEKWSIACVCVCVCVHVRALQAGLLDVEAWYISLQAGLLDVEAWYISLTGRAA